MFELPCAEHVVPRCKSLQRVPLRQWILPILSRKRKQIHVNILQT